MRASRIVTIPSASMADVAFLLLLFFLVATAIRPDIGLPLALPPPVESHGPSTPVTLSVLIDARGDVRLNGEAATREEVRSEIAAFAGSPSRRITLRTHRATPYAAYVSALDAVLLGHRDAGAEPRLSVLPPADGAGR